MIADNDPRSLRERVFDAIENDIIDGVYKDGEGLNEIKIAKELGVSRTPVRESLMQLELEGLVRNIPNKGAVVIGISEKDIEDIYAIRIRIEGLAARLCAENGSKAIIDDMERIVSLQEFYLMRGDIDQLWSLDTDFHQKIYDGSSSRPLRFMLSNFHNYIKRARDISVKAEGRAKKSVAEHRGMLDAIEKGNGELAEELTAQHITNAKNNLVNHLQ